MIGSQLLQQIQSTGASDDIVGRIGPVLAPYLNTEVPDAVVKGLQQQIKQPSAPSTIPESGGISVPSAMIPRASIPDPSSIGTPGDAVRPVSPQTTWDRSDTVGSLPVQEARPGEVSVQEFGDLERRVDSLTTRVQGLEELGAGGLFPVSGSDTVIGPGSQPSDVVAASPVTPVETPAGGAAQSNGAIEDLPVKPLPPVGDQSTPVVEKPAPVTPAPSPEEAAKIAGVLEELRALQQGQGQTVGQ